MTTQRERDQHGKFHIDEAAAEERRATVVRMHVDGHSFRAIGKALGINEGTAYRDYAVVLDRTRAEANASADDERRASLERIDRAILVLMPRIDAGELEAMDRLERLEKRRASLLGLDAPVKQEIDTHAVLDVSPAVAARLVRERFGQHAAKVDPVGDPGEAPPASGDVPGDPPAK